jgi:hypothetical protein
LQGLVSDNYKFNHRLIIDSKGKNKGFTISFNLADLREIASEQIIEKQYSMEEEKVKIW